jgi:hypothetical protein
MIIERGACEEKEVNIGYGEKICITKILVNLCNEQAYSNKRTVVVKLGS